MGRCGERSNELCYGRRWGGWGLEVSGTFAYAHVATCHDANKKLSLSLSRERLHGNDSPRERGEREYRQRTFQKSGAARGERVLVRNPRQQR